MSSLATASRRATSEPPGTTPVSRGRGLGVSTDAALAGLLAVGFGLVVFVATGGTDIGPNTWVEIGLLAVGAGSLVALALGHTGSVSAPATAAVALFAALAALTYLSIAWSVQPATSWVESNRTLSYLAAFAAAAALARIVPRRWPAVLGAVATVTVAVCGYALLTKVFPASLGASDTFGRLRVPFDYWNATGLLAALGLPALMWAGTRPATGRLLRSLTVPALVVLLTTLMLSYSRGALLAAVLGLGCWFVLVPLRLRGALLLALGGVGGALATGWALAHHAITHAGVALAARTSAGHAFGAVLLVVLVLSAVAGFLATRAMDRAVLPADVRRRIGIGLVVLLALVPVAAVIGAAASSRGLSGQVSHVWSTLTSTNPQVSATSPSRLAELSNSRPLYWSEGLKVGSHAPVAGVGAGGFETARTHYSSSALPVSHAHSYLIETFADLGVIGIVVSLALLVSWGLAARRTLGAARDPGDPHAAERIGMVTMLSVVIIWAVSSAIDWTWFVPGVTVPALVCAGWLAARGPLAETPGPAATKRPAAAATTRAAPGLGRVGAAIAVLAGALIAGWFVWQPLHSSDQVSSAIDAMIRGDAQTALAEAKGAAASDPVSVDPLWELAAIYSALHDPAASRAELLKATQVQPSNPQTWQQLGSFDLQAHRSRLAVAELATAFHLDRTSLLLRQLIGQALFGSAGAPRGPAGSS